MGDLEEDIRRVQQLHFSGSDKVRIASSLNSFMIKLFRQRIKHEHPLASENEILKILRKELAYGRRDNL